MLKNYEDYIFPTFNCVVTSGGNNKLEKLFRAVGGCIEMVAKLLFDRQIKIVHIHTASYNSFKRSSVFLNLANLFGKKQFSTSTEEPLRNITPQTSLGFLKY